MQAQWWLWNAIFSWAGSFLRGSRSTKLLRRTDGCILSLDCFASQVALTALLWCSWFGGLAVDGLIVVFCVSIVVAAVVVAAVAVVVVVVVVAAVVAAVAVVVGGSLAADKSLGKFFLEPHPFWYATTASLRNPTAQNLGEDEHANTHFSPIHNHQPVSYVIHQAAFFRASFFRSLLLWFSSFTGERISASVANLRVSGNHFSENTRKSHVFLALPKAKWRVLRLNPMWPVRFMVSCHTCFRSTILMLCQSGNIHILSNQQKKLLWMAEIRLTSWGW